MRLGLIELYKNKIRYIGFTQKEKKKKYESKFLSQEEYDTLTNFYNEYLNELSKKYKFVYNALLCNESFENYFFCRILTI